MSNTVAGKNALAAPADRGDGASLYAVDGGRKYLNRAESQRVLVVVRRLDASRALFALTLAWTGARLSEILALTPASFQIDQGVVALTTLKRRRWIMREVPIPPALMVELERHFALAQAQSDQDLARVRFWPWSRVTGWRVIKAAMLEAGIVGRQACPRGLRDGFGVGALQAGVPLNLLQRWFGHARISTTAIYTNAAGPEERAFAARFWRSAEG
jgi:integrase